MNENSPAVASARIVEIGASAQGQRIDNFLIKTLKSLPRSRIYRIIRKGEVRVNKKRVKPEFKLSMGDLVRIPPLRDELKNDRPVAIPAELLNRLSECILYENRHILVVDKPTGLAVHTGSGLRYGLIDVMRRLYPNIELELVHRLDRDTSGCLLLAKHRTGLLEMQRLLQAGDIRKHYIAIVRGHWPRRVEEINLPLKRMAMPNGENKVYVDERGLPARTRIRRAVHHSRGEVEYSLLDIELLSGRTHQIRVHCQSQHHEVAGDAKYGDRRFNQRIKKLGSKRLLLHAAQLEIPANAHTEAITIRSQQPAEFKTLTRDEQKEI